MDNESSVKILESFSHLVNDESDVNIFENILGNDVV
jgi:hypothetical protein